VFAVDVAQFCALLYLLPCKLQTLTICSLFSKRNKILLHANLASRTHTDEVLKCFVETLLL